MSSKRPLRRAFLTGGTGYLGQALTQALVARGHEVQLLCRAGSEAKVGSGAMPLIGNPLEADTFGEHLKPDHVVVHLVGTPKPAPWKAESFKRVDLGSIQQLAYVDARRQAEAVLAATTIPRTILRPWYVLGHGHRWPYLLLPVYWMAEQTPGLRAGALRLGLVTLPQMVRALTTAVESAGNTNRVIDVPGIRAAKLA